MTKSTLFWRAVLAVAVALIIVPAAAPRVGVLQDMRRLVPPLAEAAPAAQVPGYQLLESIVVPPTGGVVTSTTVLALGTTYTLRATGLVANPASPPEQYRLADAEWWDTEHTWSPNPFNRCGTLFDVDMGVGINDTTNDANKFPDWGAFQQDGVYTVLFPGEGSTITVNYHDCFPEQNATYAPNPLTLEIWAPLAVPTSTPTATPTRTPTPGPSATPPSTVVVDFQDNVFPTTAYTGTRDTYIRESNQSANFATATELIADGDEPNGSSQDDNVLLKWDISQIPVGSTVQNATVTLYITNGSATSYPLYKVHRPWTETDATWVVYGGAGLTWAQAGARDASDRGFDLIGGLVSSGTGFASVPFNTEGVARVQEWVNIPASNNGIIVTNTIANDGIRFQSSEHATPSQRPRLTITYVPPQPGTPTPTPAPTFTPTPAPTPVPCKILVRINFGTPQFITKTQGEWCTFGQAETQSRCDIFTDLGGQQTWVRKSYLLCLNDSQAPPAQCELAVRWLGDEEIPGEVVEYFVDKVAEVCQPN